MGLELAMIGYTSSGAIYYRRICNIFINILLYQFIYVFVCVCCKIVFNLCPFLFSSRKTVIKNICSSRITCF